MGLPASHIAHGRVGRERGHDRAEDTPRRRVDRRGGARSTNSVMLGLCVLCDGVRCRDSRGASSGTSCSRVPATSPSRSSRTSPRQSAKRGEGSSTRSSGPASWSGSRRRSAFRSASSRGSISSEFGTGMLARVVRFVNDTLNATPSIVAGLFAYTLIVLETRQFSGRRGQRRACRPDDSDHDADDGRDDSTRAALAARSRAGARRPEWRMTFRSCFAPPLPA